jgi:hypothetical protein
MLLASAVMFVASAIFCWKGAEDFAAAKRERKIVENITRAMLEQSRENVRMMEENVRSQDESRKAQAEKK